VEMAAIHLVLTR